MKNELLKSLLSRRGFLRTATLGAAGSGLLFGSTGRAQTSEEPYAQILDTATTLVTLWTQKPELPGLVSFNEYLERAYPKDLSPEEGFILRGAFYLQASALLQCTQGFPSASMLEQWVSTPLPMERLGVEYCRSVLGEALERMNTDSDFAERIQWAGTLADGIQEESGANKMEDPIEDVLIGCVLINLTILILLLLRQ